MVVRYSKIILGLALVVLLAGAAYAQATRIFTGKITEIDKGNELDIDQRDIFYTLRLEEYPKIRFRLTPEEAVKSGVIEARGTSGLLTPRMSKGLGWKVTLTCEAKYTGERKSPTYQVIAVERLKN